MNNQYFSIKKRKNAVLKEKSSNYRIYAYSVSSINDVKESINKIKKINLNNSHICYGYRYYDKEILYEYSSDGGEPPGSAGIPILNAIKSKKIINVIIFVVRFFGGKKIGIPGLIKVYSKSANLIIDKIVLVKWIKKTQYHITVNYNQEKILKKFLNKNKIVIINEDYNKNIKYLVEFDNDKISFFLKEIMSVCKGNVSIEKSQK